MTACRAASAASPVPASSCPDSGATSAAPADSVTASSETDASNAERSELQHPRRPPPPRTRPPGRRQVPSPPCASRDALGHPGRPRGVDHIRQLPARQPRRRGHRHRRGDLHATAGSSSSITRTRPRRYIAEQRRRLPTSKAGPAGGQHQVAAARPDSRDPPAGTPRPPAMSASDRGDQLRDRAPGTARPPAPGPPRAGQEPRPAATPHRPVPRNDQPHPRRPPPAHPGSGPPAPQTARARSAPASVAVSFQPATTGAAQPELSTCTWLHPHTRIRRHLTQHPGQPPGQRPDRTPRRTGRPTYTSCPRSPAGAPRSVPALAPGTDQIDPGRERPAATSWHMHSPAAPVRHRSVLDGEHHLEQRVAGQSIDPG